MFNRKVTAIFLLTSMLTALTGCGKDEKPVEEGTTMSEAESIINKPLVERTSEEIYADVLAAYKAAYDSGFTEFDGAYVVEGDTQLEFMSEENKLYYAFKDLDGNGVDELFVGAGIPDEDGQLNVTIYEALCYNGSIVQKLFPDYIFGYRNTCCLCENGVIAVSWTDGAFHFGFETYVIGQDGQTVELQDSISAKGTTGSGETAGTDDPEVIIKYYHNNEEITEDEFYNTIELYKAIELEWMEF